MSGTTAVTTDRLEKSAIGKNVLVRAGRGAASAGGRKIEWNYRVRSII
jgi:hypothetical protein